jgi:hypothetical protein
MRARPATPIQRTIDPGVTNFAGVLAAGAAARQSGRRSHRVRNHAPWVAPLFSCHARASSAFTWSEVTMLGFMRAGGFNMLVLVALALPALWTAIRFARNADPHRLSIVRALTLALAFASITGWVSNLVATARFVIGDAEALRDPVPVLLTGFAEGVRQPDPRRRNPGRRNLGRHLDPRRRRCSSDAC